LQKYKCEKECKKSKSAGVGLPFSDKKIIPQNLEQVGTDGSSVGIPPFCRREKPLNSVSNQFSEEKNTGNSVPNQFSE
jgi:hypothetical protein